MQLGTTQFGEQGLYCGQPGVQTVVGQALQQTQPMLHGLPPHAPSQSAFVGQSAALQRFGQPPPHGLIVQLCANALSAPTNTSTVVTSKGDNRGMTKS